MLHRIKLKLKFYFWVQMFYIFWLWNPNRHPYALYSIMEKVADAGESLEFS